MEEYVWISSSSHDPVFSGRSHPILLRLANHYNVKISIAEPENADSSSYLKAVYDAAQRRVAGLMIVGWAEDKVIAAVDAAVESGIPVVCVDKDIPRCKRHAYVGVDWQRLGSGMADRLAALLNRQGKVLLLGTLDQDNVTDAIQGFRRQITRHPGITVFAPDEKQAAGVEWTESVITAFLHDHGELNGIVGFDENCGAAAVSVLEKMALTASVKLICVDAGAPQSDLIRSGAIDAVFLPQE